MIVDKNLTYQDILKFLKLSSFPVSSFVRILGLSHGAHLIQSNMAVVNEDFTADCMAYQFIVNPKQTMYYLEGQKQVLTAQKPAPAPAPAPAPVPQIIEPKPARAEGDNDHAPEKETFRLDENPRIATRPSPEFNEIEEPCNSMQKQHLVERTGANRNALDEAIEEAKAVRDLVCSPWVRTITVTKADRITSHWILTKTKVRHPTQPAKNQMKLTVKWKRNQTPKNAYARLPLRKNSPACRSMMVQTEPKIPT